MKSRWQTLVVIAAVIVLPARAALCADADNAADLYRQALKATPVSPEDLEIYKAHNPSQEAVKTVLAKGTNALRLLHEASALSKCDWKIDTTDPTDTYLAFLSNVRSLDELSYLQVNSDISSGEMMHAAEALSDRLVIGRRLQNVRLMAPFTFGAAFEESVILQTSANLPMLDSKAATVVSEAWAKVEDPLRLDEVLHAEEQLDKQESPAKFIEDQHLRAQRLAVLRAMFTAALKSPKGGAEQFAGTKDPSDGKPFEYKATKHGYQLASEMQYKGKPVTLAVGEVGQIVMMPGKKQSDSSAHQTDGN